VTDFRVYRAGFLPALVAIVVLLFSLQAPPPSLTPVVGPAEFDQAAAAGIAHRILDRAPVRPPGGSGDAALAAMIERRFRATDNALVSEQRFGAKVDGEEVQLRNLILTLPGESPRSVVVLASRDAIGGPGAASSAAATAILLELVGELESSRHTKTLVFVSTDGGSEGALGAKELAARYPQRELIDAAIVLWQPGAADRRPPALLEASDGPRSASSGLVRTGERALADQAATGPEDSGTFSELAALALPSGLDEAAVLIDRGIDAIGLSAAGERPLPPSANGPEDLSASTLGDFGRTALLLTVTLDAAAAPPEHGPDAYITLAGSLVPGWSLALLGLTLLLPAALASIDGLGRALRRGRRIGRALWWSASRALPPLAALALLHLLGASGIVARPAFPFDPGRYQAGAGEIAVVALLGLVILAGFRAIGGSRVPPGLGVDAAIPALGLASALAVLLAWVANPFLALLLVPAAHVWLLGARRGRPLPRSAVAGAAALSLVPLGAAIGDLIGRLDLGVGAPWQLLLMVGDGQIGLVAVLSLSLLAGCLLGLVAVAGVPRGDEGGSGPVAPPVATGRRRPPVVWTHLLSRAARRLTILQPKGETARRKAVGPIGERLGSRQ
jgi:hypothetical protein